MGDVMCKFNINNFVVDKVKTINVIQSKCHVCGFDNPKEEMFHLCPICKTNLVVETANMSEHGTLCASFVFGQ